jgi:hypothetical protein
MSKSEAVNPALLFEPGTHQFTGTVKVWQGGYGEVVTDSGVHVPFVTTGHPSVREGTRVTLAVRKYRPLFHLDEVYKD